MAPVRSSVADAEGLAGVIRDVRGGNHTIRAAAAIELAIRIHAASSLPLSSYASPAWQEPA